MKNKLCTLKERRTSKDANSRSQGFIEHYKDEDLLPGWIKEIKIRERADGIRKDPFYIDPKSRYIFHSKKGVLRYLETGEIIKHAFKPKEKGDNDQELISEKISVKRTRETLYYALLQDISFFDSETVGDLTSGLGADCKQVSRVIGNDLNLILRNILQSLGLCTLIICFTLGAIMLLYDRYLKKAAKIVQDVTASSNDVAQETLSLIRTVRVYGTEKEELGR